MFKDLMTHDRYLPTKGLAQAIPAHWSIERFGRVAGQCQDTGHPDEPLLSVYLGRGVIPYAQGSKRVHAPSDDLSSYQLVSPGDFVLNNQQAWRGSVGVSGFRGIVSPAYLVYRLVGSLTPAYGRFLLTSPAMVDQYVTASKGVGDIQRTVHWPYLRMVEVPVPPLDEQAAIVTYLGHAHERINKAIAAKRHLIALLDEQKQVVIDRIVTRGLDLGAPLVHSGIPWIGQVPTHWEVLAARYLFRPVSRPVADTTLPQLSLTRSSGLIRSGSEGSGTKAAEGARNLQQCEWGDFVLNKYRAHMGLFRWCREPGLVTRNYTVLQPTPRVDRDYFEYLFLDPVFADGLRVNARGVGEGMSPLYTSTLMAMKMPVPPLTEQRAIVDMISTETERIDGEADLASREVRLLTEFRDRLTSDVVTGQFDVRAVAGTLPTLDLDEVLASQIDDGNSVEEDAGEDGMEDE